MIKNILFIQPFSLIDKQLSDILLVWPFYLENYLRNRFKYLNFDTIYLPAEQKRGTININNFSIQEIKRFHSEMDNLITNIDFELNAETLICISCSFSTLYIPTKIILDYFQKICPECIFAIGGAHVSACPDDFYQKNKSIDFMIFGEGELPLARIIENSSRKRNSSTIMMKKEYIPNLDLLPVLEFEKLSLSKYIDDIPRLAINLSRGCPFSCRFCMEKDLREGVKNTKAWRAYSPSRAILDIKAMIDFGFKHNLNEFGFLDSIFGFNNTWLLSFLKKYNFQDICSIWTETRLDILNETILKILHKKRIFNMYGLEHFSHRMLKIMNKTQNPNKFLAKFDKILKIHDNLGYMCVLNILLNHPGETSETLKKAFKESENIIKQTKNNQIYFNIKQYHNFPGTYSYENEISFRKDFGTKYYEFSKNWWVYNDLDIQNFGVLCIRSSKDLSLKDFIISWTNKYIDLNNQIKDKINNMDLKKIEKIFQISNLNMMNKTLEERKDRFFSFLKKYKIEGLEKVIKNTA
ncbi:MAG: hypothetical protein EU518_00090 [Promethearchaeota archaeon]|nr:MAG: hypothetical protein EU518_00090 [Candidatus Lokiarchaeota archaeon]